MNCAVCGSACAIDMVPKLLSTMSAPDPVYHMSPVTAPLQRAPRATYFDAVADVDFCGAECSLAWHRRNQYRNQPTTI